MSSLHNVSWAATQNSSRDTAPSTVARRLLSEVRTSTPIEVIEMCLLSKSRGTYIGAALQLPFLLMNDGHAHAQQTVLAAAADQLQCQALPQLEGVAPLVAAMSCGLEMTASIKPYSVASSAPMKKSLSVSCTAKQACEHAAHRRVA